MIDIFFAIALSTKKSLPQFFKYCPLYSSEVQPKPMPMKRKEARKSPASLGPARQLSILRAAGPALEVGLKHFACSSSGANCGLCIICYYSAIRGWNSDANDARRNAKRMQSTVIKTVEIYWRDYI